MRYILWAAASAVAMAAASGAGAAEPQGAAAPVNLADAFGAREGVQAASLSPDGKSLVYIAPGAGKMNAAVVLDLTTGDAKAVTYADGNPLKLTNCGWSSNVRLVCSLYGISIAQSLRLSWTRLVAVDKDGRHQLALGRPNPDGLRLAQYDGRVVDWLSGDDGAVLMERDFVPQKSTGTIIQANANGLGVERVDTRSGASHTVEAANREADRFLSDGNGVVRIMALEEQSGTDMLTGTMIYKYRPSNSRAWADFSRVTEHGPGLRPIAVDGERNVAYALKKKDGRDALYRVSLDGKMTEELVYADPAVDVDDVVTVGRHHRVIGFSFLTDRRNVRYFDQDYADLASGLARVLPKLPLIEFVSTSADEKKILVFAASNGDPGRYYLFDRDTHSLGELMPTRSELAHVAMGKVTSIRYPAADGTLIPAYLTLPPGSDGKNLPALVMPHGGPASRDEGGFDWLSQYFAQRGFAVIQPEYRGSTGYGDAWFQNNGFKSWRVAMGDVGDAGRWLVKQGIAAPDKLAIFGWSYGGYAALQSNVVDPALFKAVVAVAPVTDFDMEKEDSRGFTNYNLVVSYIGNGTISAEGSPDRHASAFQAPVLMFHGDNDLNVGIGQSRAMDAALHRAGKQSRLVVYPGLDHQLDDAKARADMLAQSDAFLRTTLKLGQP